VISIVRAPLLVVALASVEEELVDVEELVAAAVSPRASAEVDGPFWPQPARRVAERRDKESTQITSRICGRGARVGRPRVRVRRHEGPSSERPHAVVTAERKFGLFFRGFSDATRY